MLPLELMTEQALFADFFTIIVENGPVKTNLIWVIYEKDGANVVVFCFICDNNCTKYYSYL